MAANVEAMVREGTNALKAGRKEEARALLMKAVELDELNEEAWLWLSAVVETEEDQQTCLENVLAINPSNERARQGMKYLEQQRSGGTPPLNTTPMPTPAPPPVYAPTNRPPETSTSVEWGVPSTEPSEPTSPQRAPDLSEEDYDNWVSTLNIPTNPKQAPGTSETTAFASSPTPFLDEIDEVDDIDEPEFGLDLASQMARAEAKRSAQDVRTKAPGREFGDDTDFDTVADNVRGGKPGIELPKMPKMSMPSMPRREKVEKPKPEPVEPIFEEIPEEIRPTRMPGTNERVSPLVLLLLVLVLGANIGMAILLVQSFMAS